MWTSVLGLARYSRPVRHPPVRNTGEGRKENQWAGHDKVQVYITRYMGGPVRFRTWNFDEGQRERSDCWRDCRPGPISVCVLFSIGTISYNPPCLV